MTEVDEACADLERWLPAALELLAEPDADGTSGGGKPGSSPPWNPAAAAAYFSAHALIRDTENLFRLIVTGSTGPPRSWSAASTGRALAAIGKLAAAVPADAVRQAVRDLNGAVTVIQQLPGIDEAERPQKVRSACPYCPCDMLRAFVGAGIVTCLKGDCADGNGNHPVGRMGLSPLDGVTPVIEWADGLVT